MMFYVLGEKAIGGKGFTVRNHRAQIVYLCSTRKEAEAVCARFNAAAAR